MDNWLCLKRAPLIWSWSGVPEPKEVDSENQILDRSYNSPDPVRTGDLRNLSLNSQQWNLQLNIRSNLQLNLHLKSQSIPRAQPNSERTTKPSQISAEQLEHAGRVKPFHEIYLKLWRFFICAFNNFRRLACIQIHYFRLLFRQCAVVCLVNCRLPYRSFSPGIECRILNLTTCVCGIPCGIPCDFIFTSLARDDRLIALLWLLPEELEAEANKLIGICSCSFRTRAFELV